MAALGVRLGDRGTEQKEKGLMDMDNSVVVAGGRGDGYKGLNGNVKQHNEGKIRRIINRIPKHGRK